MDSSLLKQKLFAFKIKQNYPFCTVVFEEPSLLQKLRLINLYLIKDNLSIRAVFSPRSYSDILEYPDAVGTLREPELLLHSCKYHDWKEVVQTLSPFNSEIHVSSKIIKQINKSRVNYDDSAVDPDVQNYGADIVHLVNKRIFELIFKMIQNHSIKLIEECEMELYGKDLFDAVDCIVLYALIHDEIHLNNDFIKSMIEKWDTEMVEMVFERTSSCRYHIFEHFSESEKDTYILNIS